MPLNVLLLGEPSGLPVWWASAQQHLPQEGGQIKTTECAKTLYSCGYEEPCRWLPCGLGRYKVNGKMRDFHSFLGFLWVKHRFLPDFGPSGPLKPAFGAGLTLAPLLPHPFRVFARRVGNASALRYFSPKSTFL